VAKNLLRLVVSRTGVVLPRVLLMTHFAERSYLASQVQRQPPEAPPFKDVFSVKDIKTIPSVKLSVGQLWSMVPTLRLFWQAASAWGFMGPEDSNDLATFENHTQQLEYDDGNYSPEQKLITCSQAFKHLERAEVLTLEEGFKKARIVMFNNIMGRLNKQETKRTSKPGAKAAIANATS
jgi:hypothetical protein